MISAYVPDVGVQEHLKEQKEMPIWKLRCISHLYIYLCVFITV